MCVGSFRNRKSEMVGDAVAHMLRCGDSFATDVIVHLPGDVGPHFLEMCPLICYRCCGSFDGDLGLIC